MRERRSGWLMLAGALCALVLIPFALFEDASNAAARRVLDATRSPALLATGVAALLAADVVLPVPSNLGSTTAGTLLGGAWGRTISRYAYEDTPDVLRAARSDVMRAR